MIDEDLIKKDYGPDFQKHLLEQYKLFVETSLDVTSKRLEANKFHLTLNSIIFGLAGSLTILNQQLAIVLLSIVGIVVSIVWSKSINSYRELNKAKFKVIHQLEEVSSCRGVQVRREACKSSKISWSYFCRKMVPCYFHSSLCFDYYSRCSWIFIFN